MIVDTIRRENEIFCEQIKESVLKELDYQFRLQAEREDERENERVKTEEEHFRQIDELIRRKQEKGKKKKSTHFSECFVSFAFKNDTYSSEIEPVGQAPAQEPQLMHLSGINLNCVSPMLIAPTGGTVLHMHRNLHTTITDYICHNKYPPYNHISY